MAEIHDSSDPDQASKILSQLRKTKLRHAVILKYYLAFPGHTKVVQVSEHDSSATLLLLDANASPYDRETYPEAQTIAFIVSDHPTLTAALRPFIPTNQTLLHNSLNRNRFKAKIMQQIKSVTANLCAPYMAHGAVIFKLTTEQDALVIAQDFTLERVTSYLTFSAESSAESAFHPDPAVSIEHTAHHLPFDLFAKQGHDANWLTAMIERQQAIAFVYREGETALSACLAFQLDDGIWEVGGVYTDPPQRGKGFGKRVVITALAHLFQNRLIPRYQVVESNSASIRLAESLGMTCCQTLTHYRAFALRASAEKWEPVFG